MAHRLYLLDGMALVYRAHFALIRNPIMTSAGDNVSAVFGFTNTLLELLEKESPSHVGIAFDTSAPTPRHERYPEYKAQREDVPEDILSALDPIRRLAAALGIRVVTVDGYEADDIIGTLARAAEEEGEFETYMVTPDKDFAQLVSPTTIMLKPGRAGAEPEHIGVAEVQEKWGVERPEQVIDILGLWGDASDNIPGVPGVGEKTAIKLIGQFGSVENVLASTGELKGKQKENLENFGEQALLSKELATIILDVPLGLGPEDFTVGERDDAALADLLREFEFNAIGKRLLGASFEAGRGARAAAAGEARDAEPKTIAEVDHEYSLLDPAELGAFVEELAGKKAFCFDTETSGLDPKEAELIGIAFSWEPHHGHYLPLLDDDARAAALEQLRPVFAVDGVEKIGHNLKFDLAIMAAAGVEVAGPFFDTMLAHALLEPGQRHGMDYLSKVYLGYSPIPIDSLLNEGADETQGELALGDTPSAEDLRGADLDKVSEYAAEDADVTWQLAGHLRPLLKDGGLGKVFHEVECPLVPVIAAMEDAGIRIDADVLASFGETLAGQIAALAKKVTDAAGHEFNLNSPKQLGVVLFDELKLLEKPKRTKTGQYVTNEQVLSTLAAEHPIVADILDYREASKLKSTYVDALPNAIHPATGRIHTTFHQLVTATGRLASNHPNLQNIPIRTEQGREVRRAFVPRDADHLLVAADYSQIELRIVASMSGDEGMRDAFAEGLDIHTATAARVYATDIAEVTPEQRRRAKMVNFGIIYGISAFGLSQRLRIPRREAADIIEEYFRQYPGVKQYMDDTIAGAKEDGHVETLTGRRRHLPDINSKNGTVRGRAEREAINTPIQGTAADMIKIAMVRVDRALREQGLGSKMVLQVHDELVFDAPRGEVGALSALATEEMEAALPLPGVEVIVEVGSGENWLEAH